MEEKGKSQYFFKEGDIVEGQVKNLTNYGVFVCLPGGATGLLHISQISNDRIDNLDERFSIGDSIKVLIKKIEENGKIQLGYKQILAKLREPKTIEFLGKYEIGTIFSGARVSYIDNKFVYIEAGDDEGVIYKDDVDWNVVQANSDVLYVGEYIDVCFIGTDDQNRLKFSLKYLNKKPYEDYLYEKNIDELLSEMGIEDNCFVGKAVKIKNHYFLINLRSDGSKKGVLLTDPYYGYNLKVLILNNELIEGNYYRTKIKLVDKQLRKERNQLYQFITSLLSR